MKYFALTSGHGIENLSVLNCDVPKPGLGQVLVKIKAASLNYRDQLVIAGKYPAKPLPLIPFSDGSGEVIEVGESVTRWKAGDRVAGIFFQKWQSGRLDEIKANSALGGAIDGVLAEYVVFEESGLVAVPEHLSYEEAATLPCAAVTAWNALTSGSITCGQSVLTLGTGGVSMFAVQLAKAAGTRVIATSSSDAKLDRLKRIGADELINYKATPDWENRVLELTGGSGVDIVVEVGGVGTFAKSLKAVRFGGHMSLVGVLTGSAGEANPTGAIRKNVRMQGIFVGSKEMFESMSRVLALHKIRPVVDRVFGFDSVKEALGHMKSGNHVGKVVVGF
ncbi:MAG: NAD(P)-dependent alcohol dehydrogenase [Syntrophobacteraceae bacterium]|nr:NAD(P)-dependent alcohol dehydrogenase [Syntrophobacteraceae bacterium]